MYWNKSIDQITVEDLREMEARGTMESQHLDFKKTLPEKLNGDGKREFLKDVLSFANADGGTLLYGVAESEDDTAQVIGLDNLSVDEIRQQLSQFIWTNIEPRLDGVLIHFIPLEEDGKVVMGIDVPKSWNAPHALRIKQGTYRYHVRVNADNITMDTLQLREHILANHRIQDKIQSFLSSRYLELASGHAPVSLQLSSKLIVHMVPLSAFKEYQAFDMQKFYQNGAPFTYGDRRLNLDGYLLNSEDTYVQIYRTGIIEYVDTNIMRKRERNFIPSKIMYDNVVRFIENSFTLYRDHGIQTPIYLFITLQDVKGYCLPTPDCFRTWEQFGQPFNQHTLQLPEVLIEGMNIPIPTILKTPMDALWNSSGFPYCNYTKTEQPS